jgi:phage N-6-adenine-methyltransferase
MAMPKQKPGRSVQDVGTPDWLIKVIEQTWGKIALDAAASHENHVGEGMYYTEQDNGLLQSWMIPAGCIVYINPPYSSIRPWVQAAHASAEFYGRSVVMLVPASVGANWWAEWVDQKAAVYFIRPRLVFKGHTDPYPKDLALLVYGEQPGYKCVYVTEQTLKIEELTGAADENVN